MFFKRRYFYYVVAVKKLLEETALKVFKLLLLRFVDHQQHANMHAVSPRAGSHLTSQHTFSTQQQSDVVAIMHDALLPSAAVVQRRHAGEGGGAATQHTGVEKADRLAPNAPSNNTRCCCYAHARHHHDHHHNHHHLFAVPAPRSLLALSSQDWSCLRSSLGS